jgi:hypothetical protein
MKFLSVRGVCDYAGPGSDSRYRRCRYCLPQHPSESAFPNLKLFGAQYPAHRCRCLRFTCRLATARAKLAVRMDSLSPFLQGSFIPCFMPVYPGAPEARFLAMIPCFQAHRWTDGDSRPRCGVHETESRRCRTSCQLRSVVNQPLVGSSPVWGARHISVDNRALTMALIRSETGKSFELRFESLLA